MDQPSDEKQQPQDEPPRAPDGGRPQDGQSEKNDVVESPDSATEAKSTGEKTQEKPKERNFKIGLREVIAGVIVGAILLGIGILLVHNNSSGGGPGGEEPPKLPRPPAAQQAKDRAVPDANGPVKEKVWAPQATTFAEPFKLEGGGQPIPHNEYVMVSCKIYWPHPESVETEGYWYRIITKPWQGLFSPANIFWNGDKPGETPTHATDYHVRECRESELPDG
jgi:hypothetical protein